MRDNNPIIHVWITKYALTTGIYERDVEHNLHISEDFVTFRAASVEGEGVRYDENYHGEGKEWHRTEQGAKDRANKMVAAKIVSLKTSLAKFEKLKF